jgi:hypothetical protein
MTGLLAFDADQHLGEIAPLAISKGVRIFLPYYKLFSTADRDAIFAAAAAAHVEVGIIPIFETTAERGLQGATAGVQDGQAIAAAMNLCGQPAGTSYILTFDFDEQAAQDPACRAYASAVVAQVPGHPMIAYGNGALTEELKAAGIAKFAWDAGGMGMRGTRADIAAGDEDLEQDVGDVRGLNLGISIDSDFAPHATSPADLDAWMAAPATAIVSAAATTAPVSVLPDLKAAQTELQAKGLYRGLIDGVWGNESAAAFAAFYGMV